MQCLQQYMYLLTFIQLGDQRQVCISMNTKVRHLISPAPQDPSHPESQGLNPWVWWSYLISLGSMNHSHHSRSGIRDVGAALHTYHLTTFSLHYQEKI